MPGIKIVHFADTHIGIETYGTIDPATGLSTRVLDVLKALDQVIDYATNNGIDLVLFCGDAYKNREPSQTHQREFARRIGRLSAASIPTVLVVGNHDLPGSPGRASSIEIYSTLSIEHVYIAHRPEILNIETKHGRLQVAVFPWLRRSSLMTREEVKNLSVDEITRRLDEVMAEQLAELAGSVDTSLPAVLAGHIGIAQAQLGTERNMIIGRDPVVMLSNIANPVYDYIALGHVHRRQVLSENPPVVYAGSLERLDFGDEGETRGFYTAEIESDSGHRKTSYEFHEIPARRFLTLEARIEEGQEDPTGVVLQQIANCQNEITGAVVRLKISLPGSMASLLRDGEILKALKEAYNVTIGKEIRQTTRIRASGWATGELSPLDALKNYLEVKNVPVERRKKLLEYGEKLIREKLSADRGDYAV